METKVPSREYIKALYDLIVSLRAQIQKRHTHHVKSIIDQIQQLVIRMTRTVVRAIKQSPDEHWGCGEFSSAGWPDGNRVTNAMVEASSLKETVDELLTFDNGWVTLESATKKIADHLASQLELLPSEPANDIQTPPQQFKLPDQFPSPDFFERLKNAARAAMESSRSMTDWSLKQIRNHPHFHRLGENVASIKELFAEWERDEMPIWDEILRLKGFTPDPNERRFFSWRTIGNNVFGEAISEFGYPARDALVKGCDVVTAWMNNGLNYVTPVEVHNHFATAFTLLNRAPLTIRLPEAIHTPPAPELNAPSRPARRRLKRTDIDPLADMQISKRWNAVRGSRRLNIAEFAEEIGCEAHEVRAALDRVRKLPAGK